MSDELYRSSDTRMISRQRNNFIFSHEHIEAGDFPSAVYLVAQRGEAVLLMPWAVSGKSISH